MAAIYRGPKRGYTMTDKDVLWLARAFVGEAGKDITRKEAQWHFWAWMNRFHLWSYSNAHFKKFYELIRAHSQAVNPIWMKPGEEKCASSNTGDCSPERIARRHKMCSLTPEQLLEWGVWAFAKEAQDGTLDDPAGEPVYDFATCERVSNQGRPCNGINVGDQCFLTFECLKPGERDAIIPGEVEVDWSVKKIGVTAGVLLFGLTVGWAIYTLVRR
jgi:hypothetical protein